MPVSLEDGARALGEELTIARSEGEPWLIAFLQGIHDLLGARNAVAYRPLPGDSGWDLVFAEWVGEGADRRKLEHLRFVQACAPDTPIFAAYDPFAVQVEQRNCVLTVKALTAVEPTAPDRHSRLHMALGTSRDDQLRVLVCQGPKLLAWVGAIREEPFGDDEVAALQRLVQPLRQRLLIESGLAPGTLYRAALESMLDAYTEPALVLHESGVVEMANERGIDWLRRERQSGGLERLRMALHDGRTTYPGIAMARLASRGCPGYLLVLATGRATLLAELVAEAAREWALTSRQTRVLDEVAAGRTNKEIAALLGCAEVTVEKTLTRLFRASGTRSRAALVVAVHRVRRCP